MKLIKILYGLTLMLGCFVFASCVNDEEEICLPDGKTEVLFSLVLPDNTSGTTRADDDEPTTPQTWGNYIPKKVGVGYDNKIDLDGVKMLIFDSEKKFVGELSGMIYTKIDDKTYQYVGVAPKKTVDGKQVNIDSGTYQFVVLANYDLENSSITELSDLAGKLFDYYDGNNTTDLPNIPMWGITTKTLTVEPGNRDNIGPISLLRAVSKVTVRLKPETTETSETTEIVDPFSGWSLSKVTVKNFNKNGFVLPSKYDVEKTTDIKLEGETLHVGEGIISVTSSMTFGAQNNEVTFYLPEYVNAGSSNPVELTVTLSKTVGEGENAEIMTFEAPIQFCEYDKGKPKVGGKTYDIIRNHYYQFNITKFDDGALYVKPTVSDWIDGTTMNYPINVSTNMRLFDSWLYRYDTDGKDYLAKQKPGDSNSKYNWENWATSHIAVAPGLDETSTPAKKPLYSPQIQLLTNIPAVDTNGTMELRLDNSAFKFVKVIKQDNVIQSYQTVDKIEIPRGENLYTYFYIVPTGDISEEGSNPVAKVTLIYIDPNFGELKIPFNYNALPGYSDDSSEIWVHYVSEAEYLAGEAEKNDFLKMYYKDSNNPLVPVPVQP